MKNRDEVTKQMTQKTPETLINTWRMTKVVTKAIYISSYIALISVLSKKRYIRFVTVTPSPLEVTHV
jgi:hypothetical protein